MLSIYHTKITRSGLLAALLLVAAAVTVALLMGNSPRRRGAADGHAGAANTDYRSYSYGTNPDSVEPYSRLLSLYNEGHRSSYISASLELCGNSLYLDGQYAKALEAYTMAMEMLDETGDRQNLTVSYYNIGNIYVIFRDYERAAHYYEKVMAQPMSDGKASTHSLAARYLVLCHSRMGNRQKAVECLDEARRMPLQDRNINEYYELFCRGLVEEARGNGAKALDLQRKAYGIVERCGMKIGMGAYPLGECGRILAGMGRISEAIGMQRKAMDLARRDKAFDQLDEACLALDSLYRGAGMADSAAYFFGIHRQLAESTLNNAEFYAARNKLINYEDGLATKKIGKLEWRVNALVAGILVFMVVLAIIVLYDHKLRRAYAMLVRKNQQLIAEQDENHRLKVAASGNDGGGAYASSGPSAAQQDALTRRVMDVMANTDVICDKDFSLQTLASIVGSNTKYVSAAISATGQGSFKSMLNDCRIREACKRLTNPEYSAYTIQAVAETVGYVSVNNFIVQFKRFTGMTPSMYRKNGVQ